MKKPRRATLSNGLLASALLLAGDVAVAQQPNRPPPIVPPSAALGEAAQSAIDAAWLTDEERAELRVFHGVATDADLDVPHRRALQALGAWRLDDAVLADPAVPVEMRAQALLLRGDLREAVEQLAGADSVTASRIRAEAYEGLGEYEAATRALEPLVARLVAKRLDTAADLTEGVRALAIRARLEGQPARDYQSMISLVSRAHQQLDRLYWPARLAEGELLLDKHNQQLAIAALHETLALNPRASEVWYHLGRVALMRFDFDGADRAIAALERIEPAHPLGRLLYAESRLVRDDPAEAQSVLETLVARYPRLRSAHALLAAAGALLFDDEAARAALDRHEALSPGSAEAYATAGRFLSMFRQYDAAARMLDEAIRRQPSWPAPRLELGLMEMQTGRDEKALSALRELATLDPFNKRAANSLFLLEDLAAYAEIETDHFIIRYRPGVDEALVAMMPGVLERIHARVAPRFRWTPPQKTIIEVMPDHKRFSVRITGMPHIHTIAACTGPIIAMEVPREGTPAEHLGTFDWERVIQHEYTHTITLHQTGNRIPHWFTEALAVHMEQSPRDYDDCAMLAKSWRDGTLFDLDEIKWAFVRPRRPGDRGKAYTQGHWMVEFMEERFGAEAMLALLDRYAAGDREADAIPAALGVSREQFYQDFLTWAGPVIQAWGLAPEPSLTELTDELREADPELALVMAASRKARLDVIVKHMADRIGSAAPPDDRDFTADQWPELVRPPVEIDDETLIAWRATYPDHPDLLREEIRRRIDDRGKPSAMLVPMLERLLELRPVDDFAHRKLAQIHLAGPDAALAVPHLEAIDAREEKTPVYARELAKIYRATGDLDRALAKATRVVSMNPYEADARETVAAIAIESGNLEAARGHLKALVLLEPDRPRHRTRLERLDAMIEGR